MNIKFLAVITPPPAIYQQFSAFRVLPVTSNASFHADIINWKLYDISCDGVSLVGAINIISLSYTNIKDANSQNLVGLLIVS